MKKAYSYVFWILISLLIGVAVPYGSIKLVKLPAKYLTDFSKPMLYENKNAYPAAAKTASPPKAPRKYQDTSLAFVGDIMLDRGVARSVEKNFKNNFSLLFKKADFLKDADIAFGNLEGPISDRGEKVGSAYSFRMKPEVASVLSQAGFDVLSIANNHMGDYGREALENTFENLEKEGILPAGGGLSEIDAIQPKVIEINGLKIGFLAFSDAGPNWLKAGAKTSGILIADKNFESIIKDAAQNLNALIVSLHFGQEYQARHDKRQEELAKKAIDSGAKIVAGHHPHAVQEVERYKDGLIAYSLGNFIFDQSFSPETSNGLALIVKISPFGDIKTVEEKTVKINKFYQPEVR